MMDKLDQEIVDRIEEYGWFAMSVAPAADSDDPEEWFTYTIGLPKTFGWPEFICFGLDKDTSYDLLGDAIEECRAKGHSPTDGLELTEVINGFPARLIDGSSIPNSYFGYASWYARETGTQSPPERLQLIWPDKQGLFPNEPGCAPEVVQMQTPVDTE
jgi:hypothetical protein